MYVLTIDVTYRYIDFQCFNVLPEFSHFICGEYHSRVCCDSFQITMNVLLELIIAQPILLVQISLGGLTVPVNRALLEMDISTAQVRI